MATSCTQRPALQSNSGEQIRFMEKLMAKIFRYYDEQSLTDVTFKVSNPTALVPAHRLILAVASPFFEELFSDNEGNNPIEIQDIDSDIFERLITFCYTGQTLITVNNVGAMLKAAILLQLDDALTCCVDYLMAHINEYTLPAAYTLERKTKCRLLKQKIIEYEIQNFMERYRSDDFLNFDIEKLQRILECMRLTEPPEKTLLAVFSMWDPRLLQYNKAENKWQEYASIKIDYESYRTIIKDENLLFIGGKNNGGTSNIVRSWNIRNKTWQNFPAMKQARYEHCVVELDGAIYAIGGVGSKKTLSSVERYTPIANRWRLMKSLSVERYNANAVTLNGKIYVMGGDNLTSVECYDPNSNTWTFCADMIECHTFAGVAAHKDQIFVLSYIFGSCSSIVERYDPQQDAWSKIYSLHDGGVFTDCVSLDDKLWAISDKGVSIYDEENDCWEQKCALPDSFFISCFVVPVALLTSNE